MSRSNHTPIRTCVGCGAKKTKPELIRLAVNADGQVEWDLNKIMTGRGAYLCPGQDCLAAAIKRGRLSRAFRRSVSITGLVVTNRPVKHELMSKQLDQRPSN